VGALQQMAYFRQSSAEMRANKLLDSAKPRHTEPSDWLAVKKIEFCQA